MDPALIPSTVPGRELAWLMSLQAMPTAQEIQDHLEGTAVVEIDVAAAQQGGHSRDLASGLWLFATMVRGLPGAVSQSADRQLRLKLEQGDGVLRGVVSTNPEGKIELIGLTQRRVEDELDRVRLLYDRGAETYEQFGALQALYWDRARSWLKEMTGPGVTLLDVGCGPGHLVADLPPAVKVIGCDISVEMVRLAAARPTGCFVVHDYHRPFPTQWPLADVTAALGCLEFCSDLAQVARNLAAATKPDGRLLLTVPRAESMPPQREITLYPLPSLQITVHLWEDTDVETAFAAVGLEVLTQETGPGFTLPNIGTIEYGYWGLKAASTAAETPQPYPA